MNRNACDDVDGSGCAHLVIVGGREKRQHDLVILERFVALAGGREARIFVRTAASSRHDDLWAQYEAAFRALGVRHLTTRHGAAAATHHDRRGPAIASRGGIAAQRAAIVPDRPPQPCPSDEHVD